MYPSIDGLNANLALMMRARERRALDDATHPTPSRLIGGPLPDSNWDAFFEAMQEKEDQAHNAGMNFRTNVRGINVPTLVR